MTAVDKIVYLVINRTFNVRLCGSLFEERCTFDLIL